MLLLYFLLALELPGLTSVFTLEDSEKTPLAAPVDAVLFEDLLYVVDNSLMQLIIVDITSGKVNRSGRKGDGPKEFKFWPARVLIREPDKIQINEWNNLREHLYSLNGEHLGLESFDAERRRLYERRGRFLRKLGYNEALEHEALWEEGLGSARLIGALPEDHLFYNLYNAHSIIDIGEDDATAVADYGGKVLLYLNGKEIDSFNFPLENLKGDIRIDKLRSGFLTQLGHPDHKAYLGKAPVLDFAIKTRHRLWVLAKNENVNPSYEGDQEVWLFDANLATRKVENRKVSFAPTYIRYDYGHLILISKENASVHVFRVEN